MNARLYTMDERIAHLRELEAALAALLPVLDEQPEFAARRPAYAWALGEARRLLMAGFTQGELTALGRAVPALFWLHKDWVPPLEEAVPGRWEAPVWYAALEPLERRVVRAAEQIRVIGDC